MSSCKGQNFNQEQQNLTPCDNSKPLFSEWVVDGTGDIIDLTGYSFAEYVPVTTNGYCSNSNGDFLAYIEHDGYVDIRDCSNYYSINIGKWSKQCNVLTIEYQNGDKDILR